MLIVFMPTTAGISEKAQQHHVMTCLTASVLRDTHTLQTDLVWNPLALTPNHMVLLPNGRHQGVSVCEKIQDSDSHVKYLFCLADQYLGHVSVQRLPNTPV